MMQNCVFQTVFMEIRMVMTDRNERVQYTPIDRRAA
jgi:hypothetical protein